MIQDTYNMSKKLLMRYVRELLESSALARVPNQLIDPDATEDKEDDQDETQLGEFSAVGSIAGYTAPLGAGKMQPPNNRKKNKR